MEKLTAFLEEEKARVLSQLNMVIPESAIADHDQRLINFVLDIVDEEVDKIYDISEDDIKQILTNLKK